VTSGREGEKGASQEGKNEGLKVAGKYERPAHEEAVGGREEKAGLEETSGGIWH